MTTTNELPAMLKEKQVAEFLGMSQATLNRWRREGKGPRWTKLGTQQNSPVRYRREDVLAFAEGR